MTNWPYEEPEFDEYRAQQERDRMWVEHDLTEALRRLYKFGGHPADFRLICRNLDIPFEDIV